MDKLKMQSTNLVEDNIGKLAELFPNCITEIRSAKGELKKQSISICCARSFRLSLSKAPGTLSAELAREA